MYLVQDGAVC